MDEYTPDTDEVRDTYSRHWNFCDDWAGLPNMPDRMVVGFEVEFDRWLAARDRVVAANAWDEGYNVGGHAASGDYSGIYGGNGQEPPNPYRITEENN